MRLRASATSVDLGTSPEQSFLDTPQATYARAIRHRCYQPQELFEPDVRDGAGQDVSQVCRRSTEAGLGGGGAKPKGSSKTKGGAGVNNHRELTVMTSWT